ncbi:hypothetical protein ACLBR5_17235 [Escherichia coli]
MSAWHFPIGPSIKNSSPEEMVSVYHFWTIVLAIAGMVLYFICFKSTRENVVTVAQPSLKISPQTLKRNRPLFMLCIGALCVSFSPSRSAPRRCSTCAMC